MTENTLPTLVPLAGFDLEQLLAFALEGEDVPVFDVFDARSGPAVVLPSGASLAVINSLDSNLFLPQPDGTFIVLVGAMDAPADLLVEVGAIRVPLGELVDAADPIGDFISLEQAAFNTLRSFIENAPFTPQSSGENLDTLDVRPLLDIDINPLLPPTGFAFPEDDDRDIFGAPGGGGTENVEIVQVAPARVAETDDVLGLRISDYFDISAGNADQGETIETVALTVAGLPAGTTADGGTLVAQPDGTLTLEFSGALAAFEALVIDFPQDFSTESRLDAAPGDLTATLTATSNFGTGAPLVFPITVTAEGDVEIAVPTDPALLETDDPVSFALRDILDPAATDIDGSEALELAEITLTGLPAGFTLADLSGLPAWGTASVATANDGSRTLRVTLDGTGQPAGAIESAYAALVITAPADFSTTNRNDLTDGANARAFELTLRVVTDEETDPGTDLPGDGVATSTRAFDITATHDIAFADPDDITVVEDGGPGVGVQIPLGLDISVFDIDGSEVEDAGGDPAQEIFEAEVTIVFTGLPGSVSFNGGSYDPSTGTWTGTVADAENLILDLPPDFSGEIDADITVATREGSVSNTQVITVEGQTDIDFDISPLAAAETDATVTVRPSDAWTASSTDADPDSPEIILEYRLVLNDLPAGVTVTGVPAATIDYDAAAGGTLTFVGTPAQYQTLQLTFAKDFSSESRGPSDGYPEGTLPGTLTVTSTDGTTPPESVELTLTPEGDLTIDTTPPPPVFESDDPITFALNGILSPRATDDDGSESLVLIELQLAGLPGSFTLSDLTGVPSWASATLLPTLDGSATVEIILDGTGQPAGAVDAAYDALRVTVPGDFSTTNRSDLTTFDPATPYARPMDLRLTRVVTNEESNPGGDPDDSPDDGLASASQLFDITATHDITFRDPADVTEVEDNGNGKGGTDVPLNLDIGIGDIDGSEVEDAAGDPAQTPFAATVTIVFAGMPDGTTVNGGSYDDLIDTWTGTVPEAEALVLSLPEDYAGVIDATITVETREGAVTRDQTITITPAPDIEFDITELVAAETDGTVTVRPAEAWKVSSSDSQTDSPEVITEVRLTLSDLPAGMTFTTPLGGTVTYDAATGGALTFVGGPLAYNALRLSFGVDFSSESRGPGDPFPEGVMQGEIEADSNQGSAGPEAVGLRVTAEGDVRILDDGDSTDLADPMLEENGDPGIDPPVSFKPVELLLPETTDIDGSEALSVLNLTVNGLPGDFTVAGLSGLPAWGTAAVRADTDGSRILEVELDVTGQTPGDVEAAYAGLTLTMPDDFSTTNRSDLTPGTFARPIELVLRVVTDEEANPGGDPGDSADDGIALLSRTLDITDTKDIELSAPAVITALEDGGPNLDDGVTIDLDITAIIGDIDDSELADAGGNADRQPFEAVVTIDFVDMPAAAIFNAGTFDPGNQTWTGTVPDTVGLQVDMPGNYSGVVAGVVRVETREGEVSTPQLIVVEPQYDIVVDGDILSKETDDVVVERFADHITLDITDPSETLEELTIRIPGLPSGTRAFDDTGTLQGTFTTNAGDPTLVDFFYRHVVSTGEGGDPQELRIEFPRDFSTTSPYQDLLGFVSVTTDQGTTLPEEDFIIQLDFEGDVVLEGPGVFRLHETDDVVTFKPSDSVDGFNGRATDDDSSETVIGYSVVFSDLPPNARVSYDDGATFTDLNRALGFVGTPAEYARLVIELPADFSTENPPWDPSGSLAPGAEPRLEGTVSVFTDEGGFESGTLEVYLPAEGDLEVANAGDFSLVENDPPGSVDEDSTTEDPQDIRLLDNIVPTTSDIDGSESVAEVDIDIRGLPTGLPVAVMYSTDNGVSFTDVTTGRLTLTNLTSDEYNGFVLRLPPDFSTQSPGSTITGSVTFRTDEAILNGETGVPPAPDDGVDTQTFDITVAQEADIRLEVQDIEVIEDLGQPIDLNLEAEAVDIDGSEVLTSVSVTFDDLPAGNTVFSDGTVLTPSNNVWTGTAGVLETLQIVQFPTHYSGVITGTLNAASNESDPAGFDKTFTLSVTPVAEPRIFLVAADISESGVSRRGPGNYLVKEDLGFRLLIEAFTPDRDGSERLDQIVIDRIPDGWLPDGPLDPSLIESGAADVADATVDAAAGTLTINLANAPVQVSLGIRMTLLENDDRDVETIVGNEMRATVNGTDTAPGLPDDTGSDFGEVDIDVDAIVDPLETLSVRNQATNETTSGRFTGRQLDIRTVELRDSDGSETFEKAEITLTVATGATDFDETDTNLLQLRVQNGTLRNLVDVTQTGSTDTSVTYTVTPRTGTTPDQFADALEALQIRVGTHVSAVITVDGTVFWNETTTGDVEDDLADNFLTRDFQTTVTFRPIAEAVLETEVFVTNADFADPDSATSVTGSAKDSVVDKTGSTVTYIESTDDGTGEGQVSIFSRVAASTPDTDGSEWLETLVISNVPSDWIAGDLGARSEVLRSAFFDATGTSGISDADWNAISDVRYSLASGTILVTFEPGIQSWEASLRLQPSLYEDYDVDRNNTDPFTSVGDFFGDDLGFSLTTVDNNTVTDNRQDAGLAFDVDISPVNNRAFFIDIPKGIESVIDDAGGVFSVDFDPVTSDQDGSETVTAVRIEDVPQNITVFVPDLTNPGGPKVPALLYEVDSVNGTNTWSVEQDGWNDVEFRGIKIHTAGDFPINFTLVTTEDDGGGTGTTPQQLVLEIIPVADGGDPSESLRTDEDTARRVRVDGNIIDLTPESPERLADDARIFDIQPDSFGRVPRFFDGSPISDGNGGFSNEYEIRNNEFLSRLTQQDLTNLHVLPGDDSNETVTFKIEVTYFEDIEPTESVKGTGTITLRVTGVADDPIVEVQDPDPDNTPGGIDKSQIDNVFVQGDEANRDKVYGYAGFDSELFLLDNRFTDEVLDTGNFDTNDLAANKTSADLLFAEMTETNVSSSTGFDGSETLYYVISGLTPETSLVNAIPVGNENSLGNAVADNATIYLVTGAIEDVVFVPENVSEVTYYDLQVHAIVVENDETLPVFDGKTLAEALQDIDDLKGGAVETRDFTVVVAPDPGGGPGPGCTPEQELPIPVINLVPVTQHLEDETGAYKLELVPNPPFWTDFDDLANLPNGVVGDLGLGIEVPEGATLTSDKPGAVVVDPTTGLTFVDFAALGSNGTQSDGTLFFTPPEHQSSPVNPFPFNETYGDEDPYDALSALEYSVVLNNVTCGTTDVATRTFALDIVPVPDGPNILLTGSQSVLEDERLASFADIEGIDGGERPFGSVLIIFDEARVDLFDGNGDQLDFLQSDDPDFIADKRIYRVDPDDLSDIQFQGGLHFSGDVDYRINALSQDINNQTKLNSRSGTIEVVPVADEPIFVYNTLRQDPETGQPFVDTSGALPVITAIEDIPFQLSTAFLVASSPDLDGSETWTYVLSGVPDYLEVTAPGAGNGFIDNGDGSYTISRGAEPLVQLKLKLEHGRTPDPLDPQVPDQIPLKLEINTLELANADQNRGETNFLFQVRPDAEVPIITASVDPVTGFEDQPDPYQLTIVGTSNDPREVVDFRIDGIPDGSTLTVGGQSVLITNGTAILPGIKADDLTSVPQPGGDILLTPPANFGGLVELDVTGFAVDSSTIWIDRQQGNVVDLAVDIDVRPDLEVIVTEPDIVLQETDDTVSFRPASDPAGNIQFVISDPNETLTEVSYTLSGLPDGTTLGAASVGAAITNGTLSFTGSEADFGLLEIIFPKDWASNGTTLSGSVSAKSSHGGDESVAVTLEMLGELDLTLTVTPDDVAQDGQPIGIDMEIDPLITSDYPAGADLDTNIETLEEIVIRFDSVLPTGTTTSFGTLTTENGRSVITATRNGMTPADFTAAIIALTLTLPADANGSLIGVVQATTNHGTVTTAFDDIVINQNPEVAGPISLSGAGASFAFPVSDLLDGVSDPENDLPLLVTNLSSSQADVSVLNTAGQVLVTVSNDFTGLVTLSYDILDNGSPRAVTTTAAELEVLNSVQLTPTGTTVIGPDGTPIALVDDATGTPGQVDVALGSILAEAVVFDATDRPYADINQFQLFAGNDLVDLTGASDAFEVQMGIGDDSAIGGAGDDSLFGGLGGDTLVGAGGGDLLAGGAGADELTGGLGADRFDLGDVPDLGDLITDYEAGEVIDISGFVQLETGEDILQRATFGSGTLSVVVDGDAPGNLTDVADVDSAGAAFPGSVTVEYEDAAGQAQTAQI